MANSGTAVIAVWTELDISPEIRQKPTAHDGARFVISTEDIRDLNDFITWFLKC